MGQIPFTKLHGLGNDFVLVDARGGASHVVKLLTKDVIRAIADRKRGVGYDQLLLLRTSSRVHAVLDIYNADASMAEMCGNGLRAAALYLWSRGGVSDAELVLETAAGDRLARRLGPQAADGSGGLIECEMGVPKIKKTPPALARGAKFSGAKAFKPVVVDVGNPHTVFFTMPSDDAKLTAWGSKIETHKAFPRRTNVEFVRARGSHVIDVKVWERGVGITEACGTGAVASACAAIHERLVASPVEVRFPGGAAEVRWDGPGKPAFLRGHAAEVFSGQWLLP